MNDKPKTKPHYIAYLDVLGYSDYLKSGNGNEAEFFHAVSKLAEMAATIGGDESFRLDGFTSKTFSDNVLLAVDPSTNGSEQRKISELITMAGLLQYLFLYKYNLMMRGAIVYGDLYVDELLAFGEGLVDAANAEKKAKYPRITVAKSVLETAGSLQFVILDDDKTPYIDVFQYAELRVFGQDDPGSDIRILKELRQNILTRVRRYCKFPNAMKDPASIVRKEDVITKHLWLLEKFNDHCRSLKHEDLIIEYAPKLNKRLMKYELKVQSS